MKKKIVTLLFAVALSASFAFGVQAEETEMQEKAGFELDDAGEALQFSTAPTESFEEETGEEEEDVALPSMLESQFLSGKMKALGNMGADSEFNASLSGSNTSILAGKYTQNGYQNDVMGFSLSLPSYYTLYSRGSYSSSGDFFTQVNSAETMSSLAGQIEWSGANVFSAASNFSSVDIFMEGVGYYSNWCSEDELAEAGVEMMAESWVDFADSLGMTITDGAVQAGTVQFGGKTHAAVYAEILLDNTIPSYELVIYVVSNDRQYMSMIDTISFGQDESYTILSGLR